MSRPCEHEWVKNGTRKNPKTGFVQRWVCTKCDEWRNDYEHDPEAPRLQALALLAMRLSLDQAEYLTGLKSETIGKHLISVSSDATQWAETRKKLTELGLSEHEMDYLHSIVETARIMQQRLQTAGPNPGSNLIELKRRVEAVIGCDVVIGTSRQGVRVCREEDLLQFVRNLRKLPLDQVAAAKRLSLIELKVLRQLHSPNAQARLLSRLQPGAFQVDSATSSPLPAKLTIRSLADGLNMNIGIFSGVAIALERKLRRLTDQGDKGEPDDESP